MAPRGKTVRLEEKHRPGLRSSSDFSVGAYTNNKRMIGNLSLEAKTADPKRGALDFSKQLDGQTGLLQQGIWRNA